MERIRRKLDRARRYADVVIAELREWDRTGFDITLHDDEGDLRTIFRLLSPLDPDWELAIGDFATTCGQHLTK